MSVWSDKLIRAALEPVSYPNYPIAYVPPETEFPAIGDEQIQPASLDVRLGWQFTAPAGNESLVIPHGGYLELPPGVCILSSLVERVCIPSDVVARVDGKSSWARKFLTVHSAGFIDPGFHGDITLELKNDGTETLYLVPGVTIAQLSFQWLAAPAVRPYGSEGLGSHYQGQIGPTVTRMDE